MNKLKTATCFGTAVPSSGSYSEQRCTSPIRQSDAGTPVPKHVGFSYLFMNIFREVRKFVDILVTRICEVEITQNSFSCSWKFLFTVFHEACSKSSTTWFLLPVIYHIILWTYSYFTWMDILYTLLFSAKTTLRLGGRRASLLFLSDFEFRTRSHVFNSPATSSSLQKFTFFLWWLQWDENPRQQDLGCVVGGEEQSIRVMWLSHVFAILGVVVPCRVEGF
jgi:hypothetical protein